MSTIRDLSAWRRCIADVFNGAHLAGSSCEALQENCRKYIYTELHRKHGERAVYTNYEQGYVQALLDMHRDLLYRDHLEFCYSVDGVLFSTHKQSSHRLVEELYARAVDLAGAEGHHYWRASDKIFF